MIINASRDHEPDAVTLLNERGRSPYLLVCEHASNYIPARYNGLGLAAGDLERHIAWDPGAARLARRLSGLLDAPLFLSGYSRLLIDLNRLPGSSESIPLRSEDSDIPGNWALTPEDIRCRTEAYFTPFHDLLTRVLDDRLVEKRPSIILSVHSFSPIYHGENRIWHVGILYGQAKTLALKLIERLKADSRLVVGDNEPYQIEPDSDYTVPIHGDARDIPAVLLEVRNDLLIQDSDIEAWATRIVGTDVVPWTVSMLR